MDHRFYIGMQDFLKICSQLSWLQLQGPWKNLGAKTNAEKTPLDQSGGYSLKHIKISKGV